MQISEFDAKKSYRGKGEACAFCFKNTSDECFEARKFMQAANAEKTIGWSMHSSAYQSEASEIHVIWAPECVDSASHRRSPHQGLLIFR